jgi:hypothetical protein
MAKEDFCFTYYDGDAARDKAHMDRLERGAYDDIISAQRKKGHLSIDDIKKVLSRDFERCWPSLEWILKKDLEGRFYIEWLENSLTKSRKHSKKQKENADKRYQTPANDLPNHMPERNLGVPLEYGDEDVIKISKELCKIFGKDYQAPTERMPAESNWYQTVEDQASEILTVWKPPEATAQIQAYLRNCKSHDRKLIGKNYKAAETILSSNWLELLGENKSRAPNAFVTAEVDKKNLTPEAWQEMYAWQLKNDEAFKKHFNGKFSSSQPVGSNDKH